MVDTHPSTAFAHFDWAPLNRKLSELYAANRHQETHRWTSEDSAPFRALIDALRPDELYIPSLIVGMTESVEKALKGCEEHPDAAVASAWFLRLNARIGLMKRVFRRAMDPEDGARLDLT